MENVPIPTSEVWPTEIRIKISDETIEKLSESLARAIARQLAIMGVLR